MAELATGAVSTLLGVISNEAERLGRVRGDVQFIKEEMESMSSFLANMGSTSRQHNEQVRTWMNQVRTLANDCNNCIDRYLYRGDPELHRPRGWGLRRCLWWAPWLPRKMLAQHLAAGQLSKLKERARDIGERRLRYGVEVKMEPPYSSGAGGLTQQLWLPDTQDDHEEEEEEEEEEDQHKKVALSTTTMNMGKDDYLEWKLDRWIVSVVLAAGSKVPSPSIAFLVTKTKDAGHVASQAVDVVKAHLKRAEHEAKAMQNKIQIKWNVVMVDVPEVHYEFLPLRPIDILYYVLHELQHPNSQSQDQQQGKAPPTPNPNAKWDIYWSKVAMIGEIKDTLKVHDKIEEIKKKICQSLEQKLDKDDKDLKQGPLDQLLWQLIKSTTVAAASAEQDQEHKYMHTFPAQYDGIIEEAAKKLKGKIEDVNAGGSEQLAPEYEGILKEVFPRPRSTTTTRTNSTNTLREVDNYSDKNRETAQAWGKHNFEETTKKKMEEIEVKVTKQLLIKGIVQRIQNCPGGDKCRIVIILKTDDKYLSIWEKSRNILSLLGCTVIAGAMIVATKTTQQYKKDFCYPQEEPELVEYPLVGRFLDTLLQCTGEHMHEDIRNILHECEPDDEFSMKIFAHALHAKPKRNSEELHKLHTSLQAPQKSVLGIARKMFKFSYKDLPKEYRSCLLYLAIFPKGSKIRRSKLIGRWVAEGLITTKDWRWSSSVDEAEKCFDTLIARCLVCPDVIGATGRVKSCMVDKVVNGFITKIAMKQHILETWLSRRLAHHFSIFSDIRLRMSESIEDFLRTIPKSSQFTKLKVLDLEGCKCLAENQQYLTDICSKILMLKYLSIRQTNVTHLPNAISKLHELEVLDIRQTMIPASETRYILLPKLKRLLAGQVDSSPRNFTSGVQIPEKIEKMKDVEVLSNVEPHNQRDLNGIATLCMLKKLGVVIKKGSHLEPLPKAIVDLLDRGLRSMSITLNIERTTDTNLPQLYMKHQRGFHNYLESLSIIGITQKWELLTLLTKDANKLAKVTLSGTSLSPDDMNVLAKLPSLRCVRLRQIIYTYTKLVFSKGEFKNLNYFLMEGSNITEITFESGAASNLEKIIWSFSDGNKGELSGIDNLPIIKELMSNGDIVTKEEEEAIDKQGRRLIKTEQLGMQGLSSWKVKGWCRRN